MRIFIVLLSGLLLAGTLTACGKKGDPEYIDPNKKVMSQKILTSVS